MDALYTGLALGLLIVMQWFLVWECLKMKTTVGEHSTDLKSEMGNLGLLLDEALDFISDNLKPPSITIGGDTQQPIDFKEAILSALISRVGMGVSHGSEKEPQEREIHEVEETQESS